MHNLTKRPRADAPALVFGIWILLSSAMANDSAKVAATGGEASAPPVAARKDHWVEWHGERINDPWFWLREKANPEVVRYLEAENAYTESQTQEAKRFGDKLYSEMLARIQQTDLSVPVPRDGYEYYSRTQEGQQYPIHARRKLGGGDKSGAVGPEEVLLDLNTLAVGHPFMALGGLQVSDDGRQLLYSTDTTGFRQFTLFCKDLVAGTTGNALAERVRGFEWSADGRTVIYVTEDPTTKRSDKLWRLDLGSGRSELVFEEKDELFSLGLGRTKDRKYLVCGSTSTDTWEQRILSTSGPKGAFQTVLPREKGHKYEVEHRDGILYLRTNKDAKNFRLVTAPVADPRRWTEVIPHRADTLLEALEVFEQHLVVQEQREGVARLRIQRLGQDRWVEVAFPEPVYWA